MADRVKFNQAVSTKGKKTAPPDPRLIELVKLLARDAAEAWWAAEMAKADKEDSP